MAANEDVQRKTRHQELKHLGFVRVAAIQAIVCVLNLYDYAKQNSGPLRSAVGTVEGTVTAVVGPVFEKFKGVPEDLLGFLDTKVDEVSHKFDEHAPPVAKQVVHKAQVLIGGVSHKAKRLVDEARTGGPRAAVHFAASEYKQFLLNSSVKLWSGLYQYPHIHAVAEKAVPMAAQWTEKYNYAVKEFTQKGYPVVGYLPLVPVDEIKKTLKQVEAEKKGGSKSGSDSDSESD